ncbi:hypothetical protein PISL3812_09736 [Talaromyces islandicus]|uniref:Uncharacterized protein n=1 Tax=Talaromyces islandicus TaxID=28573 RepID=A0A0U1MBH5_TALIS|nr:hypothetical protein PISL3812_09736 [Talaromyces islandicus]
MSMDSGSSVEKPDSEEQSFPVQEITPKENADPLAHSFLEAGFHPYSGSSEHADPNITGSFPGLFSLQDIPEYLNGGLGDFGSGEKHGQYEEKILSPSTFEAMSTQNLLGAMGHDFSWGLHLDTAQTYPPTRTSKAPNPINKDPKATRGTSPKQNTRFTRETSSSRSRTPSITTCDCLQQLADQLAQIKGLNRASELLKADYILSVAREAIHRWRSQLQCNICQQNDDRDILVLSVMGFRAILNLIRRIGQDILGSSVDIHQTSPVRGQDSNLLNGELTIGDMSITSAGHNGSSNQSFFGMCYNNNIEYFNSSNEHDNGHDSNNNIDSDHSNYNNCNNFRHCFFFHHFNYRIFNYSHYDYFVVNIHYNKYRACYLIIYLQQLCRCSRRISSVEPRRRGSSNCRL